MDKLHVRPAPAKISLPIHALPRPDDPFTALYRKHRAFFRAVLLDRGVACANVDDLTHDVFAVVIRLDVYPPDDRQTRAWLWRIAGNIAGNHRTRRRYTRELLVDEVPDSSENGRVVERLDAARWIRRSIHRLGIKLRPVFVAFVIEGRAMAEIARELGIGEKTAWARLKLAKDEIARWAGSRVTLPG